MHFFSVKNVGSLLGMRHTKLAPLLLNAGAPRVSEAHELHPVGPLVPLARPILPNRRTRPARAELCRQPGVEPGCRQNLKKSAGCPGFDNLRSFGRHRDEVSCP